MAEELDKIPNDVKDIIEKLDGISGKQSGIFMRLVVPILTTMFSIAIAIFTYRSNEKVEELKSDLDGRRTLLAEQQADANLMISVLHESMPTIGSREQHQTKVLQALLFSLEKTYRGREQQKVVDEFFVSLETAVSSGSDEPSVKAFGKFAVEDADVAAHPKNAGQTASVAAPLPVRNPASVEAGSSSLDLSKTIVLGGSDKGWDFDVFWCEGANDALKDLAKNTFRALADKQESEGLGRLRLRMLPQAVNALVGYGVTGLQIRRYPDKDKQEEAERVKGWIDPGFKLVASTQRLPFYLSLFVCPEALPGP
jgi:hypothetical protein